MVGLMGKTTNGDDDTIGASQLDERQAMWGEIPGKIVPGTFDPAKGTATIQPLYKPLLNGKPTDMPEIQEVPVRFARAGGGGMTYPIGDGDIVTLRPQMRSSELYHTEGNYEPSDKRSYSLADMEAFVDGGESLTDPIKNFDAENVHLRTDPDGKYGLRGNASGKFALDGNQGDAYLLIARLAEMFAEHQTQVTAGSSIGNYSHTLAGEAADIAAKLRGMALKG